jgi:hypothetical protein
VSRSERESVIARIRNLRHSAPTLDSKPRQTREPEPTGQAGTTDQTDRMLELEQRVAHLERLVEGLQDSVHRESSRQGKRLAELETQIQPGALGAALSQDSRERGL